MGAGIPDRPLQRFSVDLGPDAVRGPHVTAAISPDGTRLVSLVRGSTGGVLLATRTLDQAKLNLLAGTEGAQQPFFSPDSQWIGFFTETQLKKISVQGGAPITLADANGLPRGGSWGDDGYIVANLDTNHLLRIPAAGGPPEMLPKPEEHGERTWRWPQVLPGSQFVIFTGNGSAPLGSGYENANVEVLSLKTRQVKIVQRGGYFGRYLPTGRLIYLHQGTLFAVSFDVKTLETRGAPSPVLDEVAGVPGQGAGQLDFSQTGTFVYMSGKTTGSAGWAMAWIDATGKKTPVWPSGMAPSTPKLSPDGKAVAAVLGGDLYVHDPLRGISVKLTFNGAGNQFPVWAPDGKHIVYAGTVSGEHSIWWIRADGSAQPRKLYACSHTTACGPTGFSPDGRVLALFDTAHGGFETNIKTLPLDLTEPDQPKPGTADVFLQEPGGQSDGVLSPDGRWMAYAAFQGSIAQVYVRPFPGGPSAGKWLISNEGRFPIWSRAGKELFYFSNDNHIMVAGYEARGFSFTSEKPRQWAPGTLVRTSNLWNFDLAPDGKRILGFPVVGNGADDNGAVHVTVLLNFFDELTRRVK